MKQTTPLNVGKTVTLNASGTGSVELGPDALFAWTVRRIAVLTSTNVLEPQFIVYVDSVSAVNALSTTYTGSGDSSDEDLILRPGQKLIGVWTGGDNGAKATMSVFGTKTPL